VDWFVDMWRQIVVSSNGAEGCVVAGVALDTSAGEELGALVRETFRTWITLLGDQLESTGLARRRAESVATAAVAGMEGALILCRNESSSAPLETVALELKRLVI
jgi:hypothetical protein